MLKAVQYIGVLIRCAEKFRNDKEVVTAAIIQDVRAFYGASKELKSDENFINELKSKYNVDIPLSFKKDVQFS